MSQTDQILAALKTGPLTPIEALNKYGCFRLASRVLELRERGYPVTVERYKLASGKRVARYWLGGGK